MKLKRYFKNKVFCKTDFCFLLIYNILIHVNMLYYYILNNIFHIIQYFIMC